MYVIVSPHVTWRPRYLTAQARFLLVELHLNALRGCVSLKAVRQAIENTPMTLDDTNDQTLERIALQAPQYAALALKVLMLLIHELDA